MCLRRVGGVLVGVELSVPPVCRPGSIISLDAAGVGGVLELLLEDKGGWICIERDMYLLHFLKFNVSKILPGGRISRVRSILSAGSPSM